MSTIKRRVDALERASGTSEVVPHVIRMDEDQSYVAAFEEYRSAKPCVAIEANHGVIWVHSRSVRYDEQGKRIPLEEDDTEPPSLADLLQGNLRPEWLRARELRGQLSPEPLRITYTDGDGHTFEGEAAEAELRKYPKYGR